MTEGTWTGDQEDQAWLERYLVTHDGLAGTVHRADGEGLRLTAAVAIPPPVLAAVSHVPRGKGMAGLAQVRSQPVQTCNLQEDQSGDINPMARLVGGQAAAALPVVDGAGVVRAVVGIAFGHSGEIDPAVLQHLGTSAGELAEPSVSG